MFQIRQEPRISWPQQITYFSVDSNHYFWQEHVKYSWKCAERSQWPELCSLCVCVWVRCTGVCTWWTEIPQSNVDGKIADLAELRKKKKSHKWFTTECVDQKIIKTKLLLYTLKLMGKKTQILFTGCKWQVCWHLSVKISLIKCTLN